MPTPGDALIECAIGGLLTLTIHTSRSVPSAGGHEHPYEHSSSGTATEVSDGAGISVAEQLAGDLRTRLVMPLAGLCGTNLQALLRIRIDESADRLTTQLAY